MARRKIIINEIYFQNIRGNYAISSRAPKCFLIFKFANKCFCICALLNVSTFSRAAQRIPACSNTLQRVLARPPTFWYVFGFPNEFGRGTARSSALPIPESENPLNL